MNVPDINTLKPAQCREVVIKKHYIEFYNHLNNNYPTNISFSEKMYWYFNNMSDKPLCPVCGNKLEFINVKTGYQTYCSKSCSNKSPEKIQKVKNVCMNKYGGVAPICSDKVKSKMINTCIERYGVENCQQNKDIHTRTKNTIIAKYGAQGNASNIIKQKYVNTCIERYGVENSSKCDSVREKLSELKRANILSTHKHIIEYIDDDNKLLCKCKCPHDECNKCNDKFYIIDSTVLANRLSHGIELCTNLLPFNALSSTYEVQLHKLLDEYNVHYETNVRNIISKELDIYIPSKKIAIEFNGIYWHSDKRKYQKYHIDKFNECKKVGVQLISIWEDQFITKYDIVKSLILSKLGIYSQRVFARKCDVKVLSSDEASEFYTHNHLQGKCGAFVHYGLLYNNEIVSVMSFGKRSIGHNDSKTWELIRYCSKQNIQVIGGASRLFNYFVKNISPKQITSWSSNDISDGTLYKMLNFTEHNNSQSYWYIRKDMKRYHRSSCSRSKLIDKGIITNDDERSETQIMQDLGFIKIWDSGQTKWQWSYNM
jgi:hypothetical protein